MWYTVVLGVSEQKPEQTKICHEVKHNNIVTKTQERIRFLHSIHLDVVDGVDKYCTEAYALFTSFI
jgi:hypothetical protein